jgi:hypothetical protein
MCFGRETPSSSQLPECPKGCVELSKSNDTLKLATAHNSAQQRTTAHNSSASPPTKHHYAFYPSNRDARCEHVGPHAMTWPDLARYYGAARSPNLTLLDSSYHRPFVLLPFVPRRCFVPGTRAIPSSLPRGIIVLPCISLSTISSFCTSASLSQKSTSAQTQGHCLPPSHACSIRTAELQLGTNWTRIA